MNISNNSKILIIGAGELGMSMIDAFSKKIKTKQCSLYVLLKKESIITPSKEKEQRLKEFESKGIEVVSGDLQNDSIEELSEIFCEFETVVNCSGFVGGKGTQIKITSAVLKAKVTNYIPWQFGVDYDIVGKGSGQPVWDEQYDVRELLHSQNITNWVIVSTGIFTSYLFSPHFGIVNLKEKVVCALGDWDYKVTVTTPEDIGILTAEITFVPELRNEVVFVAGDTISYAKLADVTEEVMGEPFERKLLNMADLNKDIEKDENNIAAKYRLAFAREDGVAWDKELTFNFQKNIKVTDAKSWLKKSIN
ncbi:aromatic alcohol reductase [Arcobacter sp. F2176]|uniref:aromatic alcohol reductase n=1 Tax=unclassified Arcobacter TaxID=2593671 RepID=UPI00100C221A|nr:aromatic alcohol reductase [Arcobacter sp. F2176]RXJ82387.1 aromatic alcohol reductase [Arcobacter sp. F2176]